ncbi:MAG: outer membrane protein assembly factor BamD [Betaproteobacteria bacterium]|nr:outer membrane protein assembly factor BamD [Betaproteobacteria bacterium]NBU50580.1 outer membrane protein assembly factor BamD [Betaproteobacteria bacterium]NBX96052.1 outer membrane protein assembly factor BamD [Betaproteobacteria bacterium]
MHPSPLLASSDRAALRLWRAAVGGLGLAAALLAGCATSEKDEFSAMAVEKLYAEAKADMASGGWDRAIRALERLEGRAAGTLLAQQASLDLAYSRYKAGERPEAVAALDRFIRLNPSSPALDYAYYLKGLVNFNDSLGWIYQVLKQDVVERDQQASRDAYQAFKMLVDQFPNSRYAPDARLRMDYIANALAEYELRVARYYFERGAYLAAANRAQQAIREFERAPAAADALRIMVLSYEQLGLNDLRDDAKRVLQLNFAQAPGAQPKAAKPWWKLW